MILVGLLSPALLHAQAIPTSRTSFNTIPAFQRSLASARRVLDTTNPLPSADTSIRSGTDWTRIGITAGSLTAAITALHIYQLNAWWANRRAPFHVIEDGDYQVNFDKFGHLFGAYYSSYFFDEAYRWAGVDTAESAMLAALSGAFWEFYVEIEDGFASDWGFSRGDAKSDMLGAAFYLMTRRAPILRDIKYKWSYFPSYKYLHNQPDIPGQTLNFIEDYTGQSYWFSLDVHAALKDAGVENAWPSWLRVALGASGDGLGPMDFNSPTGNPYDLRHLEWLVSLDYDLGSLIPESSSGFLNFVRRGLNYWHFPAPAYEFSPEHRFFILFPLKMTIG